MVFQAFFSFLFLIILNSPLATDIERIEAAAQVMDDECISNQVGVVEFLPLTSGLKVRVNAEGRHTAELRKVSEQKGHVWTPKPFQWYQVANLEAGVYVLVVSVDGGATDVFQIIIRE